MPHHPLCRLLQLDGASPGVVGCSTPAQGGASPAKTAASMLRVASRDILAPYSPLASKSIRCAIGQWPFCVEQHRTQRDVFNAATDRVGQAQRQCLFSNTC